MDNLNAHGRRVGDSKAEPMVLRILRGFIGAILGLIVGGLAVPFILALVTSVLLDDLGGPFFWVLIAFPLGGLGSIVGARMLCSANAPQQAGLAEQNATGQPATRSSAK